MTDTEIIVRDIFGDSDESDDEFEGFEGDNVEAKSKEKIENQNENRGKNECISDASDTEDKANENEERRLESILDISDTEDKTDENEKESEEKDDKYCSENKSNENGEENSKEELLELSGSEFGSDDAIPDEKPDIMSDFDIMLQKRKEMNSRRRRRKNIDLINDSDDIIAELIHNMKVAAEEDFELNRNRVPATKKLKMLPILETYLKKIYLREALLDSGILSAITDWLICLPDGSLPHLQIREKLLRILVDFNIDDVDRIKSSGIGKAIMYLYKHPKETKENRKMAGQLITAWSRPIFNLDTDFHSISRDERERRDLENMAKFKRIKSDSGEQSSNLIQPEQKALRPCDKGWIKRARVPMPSMKDYVIRPKSTVEIDMTRISNKKPITRYEKHLRNFREMKKLNKTNRAVKISIEGRKMSL